MLFPGSSKDALSAFTSTTSFEPWACCAQPAAVITDPAQLNEIEQAWMPAQVPGTVAAALQAQGKWNTQQLLDADASDWWFRTAFSFPVTSFNQSCYLCFDGLATLAEIWLNGQCLLLTDNMFRAYRIEVSSFLKPHNELVIGFRSLAENLAQKRPRPQWKTNLVNHQQLRWHRTSLLGRIPGWTPPIPPVGPWRNVWLDTRAVSVSDLRLASSLEGDTGVIALHARVHSLTRIEQAHLKAGSDEIPVEFHSEMDGWLLHTQLRIPKPPLWWPHTHGDQNLIECSLTITAGGKQHIFPCGKIGFRRLHLSDEGGFGIEMNGVPVYCRGACWTIGDIVTLEGNEESLAHDLRLARDAGMNMLRIGGTMIYESDRFYDLCDELGILVWQDFMFANMDYPVEDTRFADNIEAEAIHQLGRLSRHPCIAVYCGNSEVEQQAAMLGVPRDQWRNSWFARRLPALCAEYHPGTSYVPSTPSGGEMPFHVGTGITHFYGVGAYLRSPQELRQANIKFTPECLGFANIPEAETVNAITHGSLPVMHHPAWKQRVPRDTGAGWDFEDVRDFYLRHFFGVDPVQMRCFNMPRYLQLSRVVTGEMMAQVFAEWRSGHTNNRGGLVWFFKDLWPAAGWGIVDSLGIPKAPYYYLRRSWQKRQITLTDEGLDGLHLHITNESPQPFQGIVELLLLKDQQTIIARKETACELAPWAKRTLSSEELLERFYDVNHAYRFGPPKHDVVIATLFNDQHQVMSEAFYFLSAREPQLLAGVDLDIKVGREGESDYRVVLCSSHFLQSVSFDLNGFLPDDNYFHLVPLREKVVHFKEFKDRKSKFGGYAEALNLEAPVKFSWKQASA